MGSYRHQLVRHVSDHLAGIVIIITALQVLPCPSDLGGQTASGPPPYIQVGPPGSDFHGPGAQKKAFKGQKPQKLIILGLLTFVKNSPIKPVLGCYCLILPNNN